MAVEIEGAKPIDWINTATGEGLYGVNVKVAGKWKHLAVDGEPFFGSLKECKAKCADLLAGNNNSLTVLGEKPTMNIELSVRTDAALLEINRVLKRHNLSVEIAAHGKAVIAADGYMPLVNEKLFGWKDSMQLTRIDGGEIVTRNYCQLASFES